MSNTEAPERRTWLAIKRFVNNEPLTEKEWKDLSCLSMIDRERLAFEPGNIRWATTKAERKDNEKFYKSLGVVSVH